MWGVDCRKNHLSCLLFSHQGLWTSTFSIYTFIFSFKGMGLGEEGGRDGGMVCRLLCAHLASSRGLGCGEYWKMTGAPLKPATGGDTSIPALSLPAVLSPCLTTDSCCPSLWGLSALGKGNNEEAVPCPRPPSQKCQGLATATSPSCTEDSGGHQGLPCLLLYWVCVRSPSTFSVSFLPSFPSLLLPLPRLAQVKGLPLPPCFLDHPLTVVSFSFIFVCV